MHMQFTSAVAYSDLAEVCLFSKLSMSSSVIHIHTAAESREKRESRYIADIREGGTAFDVQTSSENNPHRFPCS